MTNYFLINKQLDYHRGFLQGMEYAEGKLKLLPDVSYGIFFSRLFDSREDETVWHRFSALTEGKLSSLSLSFFAFEENTVLFGGKRRSIEELIRDPSLSAEEKKKALRPWLKKTMTGFSDLLLHEVKGRYLLLLVEVFRREENEDTELKEMCLYFPKETWMRYLPGVYSRDRETADFTERFLSVFQSLYDDRDKQIRESAGFIHPLLSDRPLLNELASWYDLKDLFLWSDDKLKKLLMKAPELLKKRGTAAGLKEYLGLYLGTEPKIIEDPQKPYDLTVVVPQEYIDDVRAYNAVNRIIGHMKPAGMTAHLTSVKNRTRTSDEFRLGLNSRLVSSETEGSEL